MCKYINLSPSLISIYMANNSEQNFFKKTQLSSSMKIFLIRHGETTGDIEDRYGGDYDDHLSEKGKQQSKELAEKLKNKGIELIFHSPRIRATETATIFINPPQFPPSTPKH